MRVVDHEPGAWFLFEEAGQYFLEARAERAAVEYAILVALSAEERTEYIAIGRLYLQYLAARISAFPGEYWDRNRIAQLGSRLREAVSEWRASQPRPAIDPSDTVSSPG